MSSRNSGSPPPEEPNASSMRDSPLSAVVGASTVAGSEAGSVRQPLQVVNRREREMSYASLIGSTTASQKSIPNGCPGCKPNSHKKHFDDCPNKGRKRKSEEIEASAEPEPLMAVPFVDLGVNGISDYFPKMTKYLRQPYEDRPLSNPSGPWECADAKEFDENPYFQEKIVKFFGRPSTTSFRVRKLPTDDKENISTLDKCAEVLNVLVETHEQTGLNMPVGQASEVWIPGYNANRVADRMLYGDIGGGLCGQHTLLLWKINGDDSDHAESIMMDPDIRSLLTHLGQLQHGVDNNLCYMTDTAFSRHKTASRSGWKAQVCSEYKTDEVTVPRTMRSDSLNNELLKKVAKFRAKDNDFGLDVKGEPMLSDGFDNKLIIPWNKMEQENNDRESKKFEKNAHFVEKNFDVIAWSDIILGNDASGNPKRLRMDAVILRMLTVGADGGCLLNAMRTAMPTVVEPLTRVLTHMCLVLEMPKMGLDLDVFFSDANEKQKVNIASLTEPGQLQLAVYKFANKKKIRNVCWQGIRLDVESEEEMQLFQKQLDFVLQSRYKHYNIVRASVLEQLMPASKGRKMSETATPGVKEFGKYFNVSEGYHYIYAPITWAKATIYKSKNTVPEEQYDLYDSMSEEFDAKVKFFENEDSGTTQRFCYWKCSGMMPFNSGVFVRINPDLLPRYEDLRKTNKVQTLKVQINDLQQMCPMVKIWLRNRLEPERDVFELFFSDPNFVCDLQWMRENESKLPAELRDMLCMTKRNAMYSHLQVGVSALRMHTDDVFRLYGQTRHSLHEMLNNTKKTVSTNELMQVQYSTMHFNIMDALNCMEAGCMEQVRSAARSMKQDNLMLGEIHAKEWLEEFEVFEDKIYGQKCSFEALHIGVQVSKWRHYNVMQMAMGLSFQNLILSEIIHDSLIATFQYSNKTWGAPIKVADGAHSVPVMTSSLTRKRQVEWVDWKSPAAGIDSCVNLVSEENNAHGSVNCYNGELRRFYSDPMNIDLVGKHVTPLALSTWLGSGLKIDMEGLVDMSDISYQKLAYLAGYLTENRKMMASSASSEDFFGNLECFVGESGGGKGVRKEGWSTTNGLKNVKFTQMYSCPLIVLCGNRADKAMPESAFGGRFSFVHSSVLDGSTGVFDCSGDAMEVDGDDDEMVDVFDDIEDKAKIKSLDESTAKKFKGFFWFRHMCRKCVPPLSRYLTISPMVNMYTFSMSARMLGNVWRMLTRGMRRHYLVDDTNANRNLNGPWETVGLVGEWVKSLTAQAYMRQCRLAGDDGGGLKIKFERASENIAMGLMKVPVDFYAYINSLHVFTSQKSLDVNVMILACYQLVTMGLCGHCPWIVIAKVMQDMPLTKHEEQQYDELCAFLLPLVTYEKKEDLLFEARTPTALHSGYFKHKTMAQFKTWAAWSEQDTNREAIWKDLEEIHKDKNKQERSFYMRPGMRFISRETPEWATARPTAGRPENTSLRNDAYINKNVQNMIAEVWATQQSSHADQTRRDLNGSYPAHEEVSRVWKKICEGTRLPSNEQKSKDKHHTEFENPFETGQYFTHVFDTMGSKLGLYAEFLMLCKMPRRTSRKDFFSKLIAPYLRKKGKKRTVHDGVAWKEAIINSNGNSSPYVFGAAPYAKDQELKGLETVLGADVFWLVLAQALFCYGWEKNAAGLPVARIHLKNLSLASREILGMMLHSHIENAAIPVLRRKNVADKTRFELVLNPPQLETYTSEETEAIEICKELHAGWGKKPSLSLSSRVRGNSSFVKIKLDKTNEEFMYYRSILQGYESTWKPQNTAEIFPFPPESTYHMQTQMLMMKEALQNLHDTTPCAVDDMGCALAYAIQLYGSCASKDMVEHIPMTMTEDIVNVGEIPCMTWLNGWIFTLRLSSDGLFEIAPTYPTHNINESSVTVQELYGVLPRVSGLNIFGQRKFGMLQLDIMMSHGLRLDCSGRVSIQDFKSRSKNGSDNILPFTFFPIVCWPVLLWLQKTHEDIVSEDFEHFEVVHLETFFERCIELMWSEELVQAWLTEKSDIPALQKDNMRLFIMSEKLPDITEIGETSGESMRLWVCVSEDDKRSFYYFNSAEHYKYVLQNNDGCPFNAIEEKYRMLEGYMINEEMHSGVSFMLELQAIYSQSCAQHMCGKAAESIVRKINNASQSSSSLKQIYKDCKFNDKSAELERCEEKFLRIQNAVLVRRQKLNLAKEESEGMTSTVMMREKISKLDEELVQAENLMEIQLEAIKKIRQERDQSLVTMEIVKVSIFEEDIQVHSRMGLRSKECNGNLALGLLRPRDGGWLRKGRYSVSYIEDGSELTSMSGMDMDFLSMSSCMAREGEPIFVYFNHDIYELVRESNSSVSVPDMGWHEKILSESSMAGAWVRGFYVLRQETSCIDNIPCVDVLFLNEGHRSTEDFDTSKKKLIVSIPIYYIREGVAYHSINRAPRSVDDGSLNVYEGVFESLLYSI